MFMNQELQYYATSVWSFPQMCMLIMWFQLTIRAQLSAINRQSWHRKLQYISLAFSKWTTVH